jgi:hypothetical protein
MADNNIELFLSELDATFDAVLAREEAEATADLSHALSQEIALGRRLQAAPSAFLIRPGHLPAPLSLVARDYVAIDWPELCLVPLVKAIVRIGKETPEAGPRHRRSSALLLGTMRHLARRRTAVKVSVAGDEYSGVIDRAAPDHLSLSSCRGEVLIPLEQVREIRINLEGSADDL